MFRRMTFIAISAILFAAPAACQDSTSGSTRTIGTPETVASEGFTEVAGLRELSDGRVLIVDPQERRIAVLRSDLSLDEEVGRSGQGPGEFLLPVGLLALRGDTSAVVDRQNGRILLLDGVTPLRRSLDLGVGPECDGQATLHIELVKASDRQGNLYFTSSTPDAISIRRWRPGTCVGDAEAVGSIPRSGGGQTISGGIVISERPPPLGPVPAWAAGRDGQVAVVHADPFRVVFTDAQGRRHEGPAIEFEPVALSEGHKEAWRESRRRPVLTSVLARGGGGPQYAYLPPTVDEPDDWPRVLPPFPADGARFAPDGTLWVERWVEAGTHTAFDLMSPEGRVTGRVLLPPGRRLVAFGEGTLYTVVRDDMDLEYIERFRLQ